MCVDNDMVTTAFMCCIITIAVAVAQAVYAPIHMYMYADSQYTGALICMVLSDLLLLSLFICVWVLLCVIANTAYMCTAMYACMTADLAVFV